MSVIVNLGLNAHKLQGSVLDFTGKIGADPQLKLQWSYDLPKLPTINAAAYMRWTDMDMLNMGNNRLSLNYLSAKQEVFLSNMKWKKFDIKAGLRNEIFDIRNIKSSQVIGDYDLSQLKNDYMSLFSEKGTVSVATGAINTTYNVYIYPITSGTVMKLKNITLAKA